MANLSLTKKCFAGYKSAKPEPNLFHPLHLLHRIANPPIPPHIPEIRKQAQRRKQQAPRQKPPLRPLPILRHLAKTNRHQERGNRRQHGQRSQPAAIYARTRPREPCRRYKHAHAQSSGPEQPIRKFWTDQRAFSLAKSSILSRSSREGCRPRSAAPPSPSEHRPASAPRQSPPPPAPLASRESTPFPSQSYPPPSGR